MNINKAINLSLIALTAVLLFAASNAFAISQAFRLQLERSGCTQQTAGNGCDIRKSKAQNKAAMQTLQAAANRERHEVTEFLQDSVAGQKLSAGKKALEGYGFTESDPNVWIKSGDHDIYVVHLNSRSGRITSAEIAEAK
ncbi:hypothetical protein ACCY16_01940 [Candidatus Pantoea formicae]|uniref:hypothetical protein n=1 Tax=Candidatus Pantoea formicae TaxID=2608355 RepID=UPI003ED997D7